MNTPAEDDLEDLALELGATVEYASGEVFNSAGNKTKRKTDEKKQPERDAVLTALLAQVVELVKKPAQVNVSPPNVTVHPSKVLLQPAAKTSWRFDFERNTDGTINSITAKPL